MPSNRKVSGMVTHTECRERFPALTSSDSVQGWNNADTKFPIRVTRSWFERIQSPSDPLAKQVFPGSSEQVGIESPIQSLSNPVGEKNKQPVPFVVQKHPNRLLLLVSRKCHLHCRYCFRRTLDDLVEPTKEQLQTAIDYVLSSGVEEVILSGGDPLFLNNDRLKDVLSRLVEIPTVRIHSRAPITYPTRVSQELLRALSIHPNVWLIVHCNHLQELNAEVRSGIHTLRMGGIPLLNQSVLLKGINDSLSAQVELCRALVRLGVFPYYLHHTDRVEGAEDFFVDVADGLRLYKAMEENLSGMALPKYVIDLPDGSGKIPVERYHNRL